MAIARRVSNATLQLMAQCPENFRNHIRSIADGTNPHVRFSFNSVKIVRGTRPHPPNTDPEEVRNSITIQFQGVEGHQGGLVAHLFNDGTIKYSATMHQEINQRRQADQQLIVAEDQFPTLRQTDARRQAHARMMARIQAARNNSSWSVMQKQLEKDSAHMEYQELLRVQADQRATLQAGQLGRR